MNCVLSGYIRVFVYIADRFDKSIFLSLNPNCRILQTVLHTWLIAGSSLQAYPIPRLWLLLCPWMTTRTQDRRVHRFLVWVLRSQLLVLPWHWGLWWSEWGLGATNVDERMFVKARLLVIIFLWESDACIKHFCHSKNFQRKLSYEHEAGDFLLFAEVSCASFLPLTFCKTLFANGESHLCLDIWVRSWTSQAISRWNVIHYFHYLNRAKTFHSNLCWWEIEGEPEYLLEQYFICRDALSVLQEMGKYKLIFKFVHEYLNTHWRIWETYVGRYSLMCLVMNRVVLKAMF